jgi:predicted flap endonuclease-1-like 5' DNA nuclease
MDFGKREKELEKSLEKVEERVSEDERLRALWAGIPLLAALAALVWVIRRVLLRQAEYGRAPQYPGLQTQAGEQRTALRISDDWRAPSDRRPPQVRDAPVGEVHGRKPQLAGNTMEAPAKMKAGESALARDPVDLGRKLKPASPPESRTDDLTLIEGIGPKISRVLRKAGIRTFKELGESSSLRLTQILSEAGIPLGLANPETWPEQARLAAEGRWEDFEALKAQLYRGRRKA